MQSLHFAGARDLAEVRWRFGSFVVWEGQRRLERFGQAVRLGSRSFELLLQLVKRVGQVVSKDELLSTVWAGVVVEEASVRVQMSTLRKALGDPEDGDDCTEWISNVPLRGYRFNGTVRRELIDGARGPSGASNPRGAMGDGVPVAPTESPPPAFAKLPVRLTRLVGRDADVQRVLSALEGSRVVTVVGPGGIGKTRAAIRAAECQQARHATRTVFIDLSPLISQEHVLSTMARSLGAAPDAPDTLQTLHQRLTGRDALLLIDNCEHVAEALVPLVTRLLMALPRLRVLATSREALRMEGEHVLRLSALAVPESEKVTLAEAMCSPAVELLVERAKAAGARAIEESDGALLARIVRQVDGIPLAIELVAARLGVQSLGDLAFRLNDHMRLYSVGNGAIVPRHRTLAAALHWSIALLSNAELQLLRGLSVFRGRFDVDSALRVAAEGMDPEEAFDALISLANKSLLAFDNEDPVAPYRLLDTTRCYAAELMLQTGEGPALRRRHAVVMCDLMGGATAALRELSVHAWAERFAHRLDDVRAAIDACLANEEDAEMAASLTIASAPLWFHVSQIEEYRSRVSATLARVTQARDPDPETVLWLHVALGNALFHTKGPVPETSAVCEQAFAGARVAGRNTLELQALWGMCTMLVGRGDYAAALRHSQMLTDATRSSPDPAALNLSHRMAGLAHHFSGNFAVARANAEASMRIGDGARRTRNNIFQIDATVASTSILARTLWIQGDAAKALEAATLAVAHADAGGNAMSLCFALFGACPVALWAEEFELARQWVQLMLDEAQRRGLVYWHQWAQCFALGLQVGTRDGDERRRHLRQVAAQLPTFDAPRKELLVTFSADWFDEASVERVRGGLRHWSAPEVWRAAGRCNERRGRLDEAERCYLKALAVSRQQGAGSWEFRAATSLAMMWSGLGRGSQSLGLLDDVCERSTDCNGPGLTRARALRDALRGH